MYEERTLDTDEFVFRISCTEPHAKEIQEELSAVLYKWRRRLSGESELLRGFIESDLLGDSPADFVTRLKNVIAEDMAEHYKELSRRADGHIIVGSAGCDLEGCHGQLEECGFADKGFKRGEGLERVIGDGTGGPVGFKQEREGNWTAEQPNSWWASSINHSRGWEHTCRSTFTKPIINNPISTPRCAGCGVERPQA